MDIADDVVGAERGDGDRSPGSLKDDVGLAFDDQIGRIGLIPLSADEFAVIEAD